MISYPVQIQGVAAGRTGIAPPHLLDVLDTNGNMYYWASRKITAPAAIDAESVEGNPPTAIVNYEPWILSVPQWRFHRSLQTDMGTIRLQYLSGDTLQRDFEKIVRSSALEGALFVYRMWEAAAQAAYLEMHGTFTVSATDQRTATLTLKQMLNPSADPTPRYMFGEICGWRWASKQCGSTQSTECQHSFPTCQVPPRFQGIANSFEKNFGEATANVSAKVMNRLRQF